MYSKLEMKIKALFIFNITPSCLSKEQKSLSEAREDSVKKFFIDAVNCSTDPVLQLLN